MCYLLGLRAICLDFKSHIRLLLSEPFGEQFVYINTYLSKVDLTRMNPPHFINSSIIKQCKVMLCYSVSADVYLILSYPRIPFHNDDNGVYPVARHWFSVQ